MRTLALIALISLMLGCQSLDRFRTDSHSVFRGAVIGDTSDSFIRRGFATGTSLDLEFDPAMAQGPSAGTITTTSPDGTTHFARTELRVIESLEHDPLSQYDFPGAGRVRNYVYDARPETGPLAGRDAMVFISLMDDGSIEVRIVCGSGDVSRGDVFGLFHIARTPR